MRAGVRVPDPAVVVEVVEDKPASAPLAVRRPLEDDSPIAMMFRPPEDVDWPGADVIVTLHWWSEDVDLPGVEVVVTWRWSGEDWMRAGDERRKPSTSGAAFCTAVTKLTAFIVLGTPPPYDGDSFQSCPWADADVRASGYCESDGRSGPPRDRALRRAPTRFEAQCCSDADEVPRDSPPSTKAPSTSRPAAIAPYSYSPPRLAPMSLIGMESSSTKLVAGEKRLKST